MQLLQPRTVVVFEQRRSGYTERSGVWLPGTNANVHNSTAAIDNRTAADVHYSTAAIDSRTAAIDNRTAADAHYTITDRTACIFDDLSDGVPRLSWSLRPRRRWTCFARAGAAVVLRRLQLQRLQRSVRLDYGDGDAGRQRRTTDM